MGEEDGRRGRERKVGEEGGRGEDGRRRREKRTGEEDGRRRRKRRMREDDGKRRWERKRKMEEEDGERGWERRAVTVLGRFLSQLRAKMGISGVLGWSCVTFPTKTVTAPQSRKDWRDLRAT
jgi:hypothetical protein